MHVIEYLYNIILQIQQFIEYLYKINSSELVSSAMGGLFSIVAILIAAFALINRYIGEKFLGMQISRLIRYKFVWLITPLILLLTTYFFLAFSANNFLFFSIALIIFITYFILYLYFILMPIFNYNKFLKCLLKSYKRHLKSSKITSVTLDNYLTSINASFANTKTVYPLDFLEEVLGLFKKNITTKHSLLADKLLDFIKNLYLFNNINKFFSELRYLNNINQKIKLQFINEIFNKFKNYNIRKESFVTLSKDFLKYILSEITNPLLDKYLPEATILFYYIICYNGLDLFLIDISSDKFLEHKYIEFIVKSILSKFAEGLDLASLTNIKKNKDILLDIKRFRLYEISKIESLPDNENKSIIELIIKLNRGAI